LNKNKRNKKTNVKKNEKEYKINITKEKEKRILIDKRISNFLLNS